MSPSGVQASSTAVIAVPLAAKIECAILSVLVHCHGEIAASLETWFRSMRQAFPEIETVAEVRDVFKQLCEEGVIGLNSPWIGDYRRDCPDQDFYFLALDQFTTTLTAQGCLRWDSIRR